MTEQIHQLLNVVYAPELAQETYESLMHMVEAYRTQHPATGSESSTLYDQSDIMLITYGDSLNKQGQTPLQTLATFANDYLREGFSGIHILPFYPYSSDDGFSVIDFLAVNPHLGDWHDISRVGEHFKLMFDAVFNHMSAQSEWFQGFLADDPRYAGFFRLESPDVDLSAVVRPRVSPVLTPFTKADGSVVHVWTTFSADQIDLNAETPALVLNLIEILLFYVEQGASLIRLDAIAFLWKEAGTSCIHLPQTHAIIQLMRAVLDVTAPQVILITETNVPHKENISYWGDGTNEAQMVYNFTLPPLLFHSMTAGNTRKLREWINTLQTPSDRTTFFNFTASHDGIGVRPVEGILTRDELQQLIDVVEARAGRVSYRKQPDGSQTPYELNITYVDAMIAPDLPQDQQVARFMLSQAVMLSLAGVPAVYIHSLLGSRNDLVGMAQTGHNRTINRAKLQIDAVLDELHTPTSLRHQIFTAYTHLLKIRREQPAFHPNAPQSALDAGNPAVLILQRGEAHQRVLAIYNFSDQPQAIEPPISGTDLISGAAWHQQTMLAPYQMAWIRS
jgi:sucrose phosphorylase